MAKDVKGEIITMLKKQKVADAEAEALATSIMNDAPARYSQAAGFGDSPAIASSKEKAFGETDSEVKADEKLIEVEVVNDATVEYPDDTGQQELFVFEKTTLESLGKKMEGIPIVIGKGHEADLPLAHFTKDFIVKEIESDGIKRNALLVKARIREDPDSPIPAEAFFKDPHWSINGGKDKLKGSLKFNSKDIPYFFDDGSKINYMTRISPRHYALVDSPYIKESGIFNKNFGKTEEKTMATETIAVVPPVTPPTPVTPHNITAVAPVTKEAPKTETVAPVTAPVVEAPKVEEKKEEAALATPAAPETVAKSEYDLVKAQLEKIQAELVQVKEKSATSERARMVEKIIIKKFGVDVSDKDAKDFEDKELKTFGVGELTAYLAAMPVPVAKSFGGKGKMDPSVPGSPQKLKLFFMKDNK